jgi:ABC-type multidrug transport system fused ATPase/permease subunit
MDGCPIFRPAPALVVRRLLSVVRNDILILMSINLPASAQASRDIYGERAERFGREWAALDAKWNQIGNLRLFVFLLSVAAFIWGFWAGITLIWVAGIALLVAFFVLVWWHNRVGRTRRRAAELRLINQEALLRSKRLWDQLPLRYKVEPGPSDPYARDLNVFGHASLFQLADTAGTLIGERTLASWLASTAPPPTISDRQAAVAELAPQIDLRDELSLRGRLMSAGDEKPDPDPFLQWAESAPTLISREWLRPAALLSVILLWAFALAQIFGLVHYPFWAIFALINFAFSLTVGRRLYATISQVNAGERGFKQYAEAFQLLSEAPFASAPLKRLQSELGAQSSPAHTALRRLQKLVNFIIPPSAQLYFPLQALTLWDVFLLGGLERWQAQFGTHARGWITALGEAEALASLAALSHANPAWVFPDVDTRAGSLAAIQLGHPLLPDDGRVPNSVEVGPQDTFLLVTGSNMSGKSTLLRAIGDNIVLAQAGGPVCAEHLTMPPVVLWTCMRVEDSLEQGVSYFMAELQRLKQVVEAAQQAHSKGQRLFYLLDEILQGTNTAERQIAARRVIHYLLEMDALGAVSTHDLGLAEAPELAAAARPVHFTELVLSGNGSSEGAKMTFDYKLLPGIATSTNALKLMDIVFGRISGV